MCSFFPQYGCRNKDDVLVGKDERYYNFGNCTLPLVFAAAAFAPACVCECGGLPVGAGV